MNPTLQLIINVGAAVTALAAVVGFPLTVVKLWPMIKRGVAIMSSAEKLPELALDVQALTMGQRAQAETLENLSNGQRAQGETLDHQSEQLAVIKHEVEFNNGSSVKDAVVRTEKATNALAGSLNEHLKSCPTPTTTVNVEVKP